VRELYAARLGTEKNTVRHSITLLALVGCSDYELYKKEAADIFYQLEASDVDILLVVDNSCSMAPYQQELASNFDNVLTFFIEGNVNYQIGVITTSARDDFYIAPGCEQDAARLENSGNLVDGQIITPDTPDAGDIFNDIVRVGTCGDGAEMGLEAARLALDYASAGSANQGFLREDAFLSLIFVSDEQDGSPDPVNDYINDFRAVKAQGSSRADMNASALVVNDINECSQQQINSGANEGSRYIDVAEQSDGLIGNICGDDFESIVTELSLNSSRLTDTFYLSALPEPSSLVVGLAVAGEVAVEQSCTEGWTYMLLDVDGVEKPAIVFDRSNLPPPQTKVTVKYDYGLGDPTGFCEEE
jgi:hypothetical protein